MLQPFGDNFHTVIPTEDDRKHMVAVPFRSASVIPIACAMKHGKRQSGQ